MDKKRNEIDNLVNIDSKNLENMFTVKESNGQYYYDLTDTLYVNPETMNPIYFDEYDIKEGDTLYGISLNFYNTRNLWWVVAVTNKIDDPFDLPSMVGQTIKIPIKRIVGNILTIINE